MLEPEDMIGMRVRREFDGAIGTIVRIENDHICIVAFDHENNLDEEPNEKIVLRRCITADLTPAAGPQ
jgi:hypothetical protein